MILEKIIVENMDHGKYKLLKTLINNRNSVVKNYDFVCCNLEKIFLIVVNNYLTNMRKFCILMSTIKIGENKMIL